MSYVFICSSGSMVKKEYQTSYCPMHLKNITNSPTPPQHPLKKKKKNTKDIYGLHPTICAARKMVLNFNHACCTIEQIEYEPTKLVRRTSRPVNLH